MNNETMLTEHRAPLIINAQDLEAPLVLWTDHLEELRYRLWWCVGTLLACSSLALLWSKRLVAWLARPVGHLVFVEVHEALLVHVKVAVAVGCLFVAPVVAYHIWQFVGAGLHPRERRIARQLIPVSVALFAGGVVFGYAVMIPQITRVLLSFGSPVVQPMISANAYLSFVLWIVMAMGLACELPLIMWGLVHLGIVERTLWRRARPVAILIIFAVAAVVTPGPDVLSQCLVAIPMVILYEISARVTSLGSVRES